MTAEYLHSRFDGYDLETVPGFSHEGFLAMCCGVGAPQTRSRWERVGSSPFAEVHRFGYEGGQYYHKRYLNRGWSESVKARVFGSRAERAWRGGCLLQESGLGAPDMVAVGWRRGDCFTVTRAIAGAYGLGRYVRRLRASTSQQTRRRLRKVAAELGRAVGRMHRLGIAHGDLRWGNILVLERDGGDIEFVFLDNERTVWYRRLPRRKALKNLVQLNMVPGGFLSRTDRMRFWRAYRAERGIPDGRQKQWARRMIARTTWRWARRAKKNREPPVGSGSATNCEGSAYGFPSETMKRSN